MSCGPCFKLHPAIHNLDDCYPPTKQLESEKEPRPLQDGLTKLAYYTRNHPNQLSQIAKELERRISKATSSGHNKYKSVLLISLSILKTLLRDNSRDLSSFIRPSLNGIAKALDHRELPVLARACSCFASLATYTDSAPFTDNGINATYFKIICRLAQLCNNEDERISFVALVGLGGAAGSEALSWSDVEAKRQIEVILPALLGKLWPANGLMDLGLSLQDDSDDFFHLSAERPAYNRRAPSVNGEKPSEIVPTAMRALKALLEQCRVNQISTAVDSLLHFLDDRWGDEKCRIFAKLFITFAPLEYQHLVPTRLVQALRDTGQVKPTTRQIGLLDMLTTALQLRCVGLNVTNMLQGLLQMIPERIKIHERDALLPLLVECISTLAMQVYYPDQIGDMVEELSRPSNDQEVKRIQVWCIIRTLEVAHAGDALCETNGKGKASTLVLRRNPVSYDVWADTLSLLCDRDYTVRAAYTRALVLYIEKEMPMLLNDSRATLDFCNLLYASIYVLALSDRLDEGTGPLPSYDQVATPFDYANILEIIKRLDAVAPVANLARGGPVLLAMDRHAGEKLIQQPGSDSGTYVLERKRAIRETVTWAWDMIARRWHLTEITALCKKTISLLPEPLIVPDYPLATPGDVLPAPDEKAQFVEHGASGETSATARPLLDPEEIIASCTRSVEYRQAGGNPSALSVAWTLDHNWDGGIDLDDPVSAMLLDDGVPHHASQLPNVDDLRGALEKPSDTVRQKRQTNKAVLKEIFRD